MTQDKHGKQIDAGSLEQGKIAAPSPSPALADGTVHDAAALRTGDTSYAVKPIAFYHSAMKEKFGLPRQAGLAAELPGRIVFEPEYRERSAFRGLEDFSHLWLIWGFSESRRRGFAPTVRPPRLHGNRRMGVFATRSPFRPNSLGLSAVRLAAVELETPDGPSLLILGADLLDGTPIFDVKPYIPYSDSIPEAAGGFADSDPGEAALLVEWIAAAEALLPADTRAVISRLLALDPRPAYQDDPERIYGMRYGRFNVRFSVAAGTCRVLAVEEVPNDRG